MAHMKFILNNAVRKFTLNLARLRFGLNGVPTTITPVETLGLDYTLDFSL